jgi:outer membrane protein OmpA-like peptidoglycan-associated protein
MNKNKGLSYRWILFPILFSSAPVLAGGFGGLGAAPSASGQASALAAEEDGFLEDSEAVSNARMNYVGGDTRIGVGVDTEFKGRIDGSHIFMETEDSVTSGQGWLGINPGADDDQGEEILTGAGAKINHHWVTRDAEGNPLHVNKVFGAYDQNEAEDKKVSAGYGQEREDFFWSGHVSKGLSDMRSTGTKDKEHDALIYEKAYDFGVGGRVGKFMPDHLLRIQGGLDYEWGTEYAEDYEDMPSQLTVSGGVEKFFPDSPHSIGANVEVSKKSGGYETGDEETDVSGNVSYRYDFGGSLFAADEQYRRVRVEIPGKTERVQVKKKRAPKVERKLVKHTMELEADTFFEKGKHNLTPQAQQRMQTMMARIRETGHHGNIRITGNTCDLGSDATNQSLSERRAAQVRSFMVANGFNANELQARGLGETQPKYPNTEATRHRNRRVDIEYVAYQNNYKDEVIEQGYDVEEKVRVVSEPRVVWRKELIPSPPTWVAQSLRNNIQYKQTIDTYRTLGEGFDGGDKQDNQLPVAANDSATTIKGTAISIRVLDNDSDADGDTLNIISIDEYSTNGGTVAENESGVLTYTPAAGFIGTDTFTYTISDGHGGEATATVTVIVEDDPETNTDPVAGDDSVSTTVDKEISIDVLANDSDADGDTLTIESVAAASQQGGTLAISAGKVLYTPPVGFSGTDTFTYTASDGKGGTATATVTVLVGPVPVPDLDAADDHATTHVDTAVVIDVLGNDSDPDGDTVLIDSFDAASQQGGMVTKNADGHLVYTPATGFEGTDTFTYKATDGDGEEDSATVTVVVSKASSGDLDAADDSATTPFNTAVAIDVLGNDSDPDGDAVLIDSFDAASQQGGTVTKNADGHLVYTPATDFEGTDTFTYRATDGDSEEDSATVTVVVESDPGKLLRPVADEYTVTSSDLNSIGEVTLNVMSNDQVIDSAIIRIITHPSKGSIENATGGDITDGYVNYAPQDGATGTDTFTYVLVDSDGEVSEAVTVTIHLGDDPVGGLDAIDDGTGGEQVGDIYSFYPNDTMTRSLNVLGNDIGEGLTIVEIVSGPRFGTAQISADGLSVNYTLRSGYCEDHSFVYRVRDADGNEDDATVHINIIDGSTCTNC